MWESKYKIPFFILEDMFDIWHKLYLQLLSSILHGRNVICLHFFISRLKVNHFLISLYTSIYHTLSATGWRAELHHSDGDRAPSGRRSCLGRVGWYKHSSTFFFLFPKKWRTRCVFSNYVGTWDRGCTAGSDMRPIHTIPHRIAPARFPSL